MHEICEVRPHATANFYSSRGAYLKRQSLEKQGFTAKGLRNWRFVTLTIDKSYYLEPAEAYDDGKGHIAQMMYELRKKYGISRYCWKLEFHEPDEFGDVWPHWHLLIDYKRKIDADDIRAAWRRGRIEIQGVTTKRFEYLFKYVAKALDDLPYWFSGMVRPRCWQTSRNFFGKKETQFANGAAVAVNQPSPRPAREDRASDTENESRPLQRETLGERIQRWSRSCIVRITLDDGSVVHRSAELVRDWGYTAATFARHSLRATQEIGEIKLSYIKTKKSCLTLLALKSPHLLMQQAF